MSHFAAFANLIDYAGLFPPASLAMEHAVIEYDRLLGSNERWMLGRFILPHSRLDEFKKRAHDFPLSLILDGFEAGREEDVLGRLAAAGYREQISAFEIPPLAPNALKHVTTALKNRGLSQPVYAEVPLDDELRERLTALHGCGFHAKVRCGGTSPRAYPSVDQLAAFLMAVVDHDLAFKATAGLHHPIRGVRDAINGATMHGFLNVLIATAYAQRGEDEATVAAVLAETDPHAFGLEHECITFRGIVFEKAELKNIRVQRFHAYGSCSFVEPLEDLIALGLQARI